MFQLLYRKIVLWLAEKLMVRYHGPRDHLHTPAKVGCRNCDAWRNYDNLFMTYL